MTTPTGFLTGPFTRSHVRALLALCLSLAGSAGLSAGPFDGGTRPTPTTRQDQVASVHVAVTSVRPWEEYVEALQPKFELTPAAALGRVAEATRLQDNRAFDGLGFSLRAEIGATLGGTNAEAISVANEGVAAGRAAAVDSALKTLTNPVPVASSLHYLAATALYQEVQLINRAFRDAVEFEGFTPYVVRLQVTVMPRKRQAPFDVVSDLSLQVGPPQLELAQAPAHSVVKVVPMLVTDSIESALHSQSEERLRSLSLALAAVLPKASLGASFDRVKDAINSMVGRDYNAMFTVARLTDSTVRCRIGALAQTAAGFSLVPQNHSVTLLVFVPETLATDGTGTNRQLRLIANNSLVSVKTGETVRQLTNNDFIRRIERFLEVNRITFCSCCQKPDRRLRTMAEMFTAVAANDFAEFIKIQKSHLTQPGADPGQGVLFPDALWSELTAIWSTSQFAVAQFQLPKRPEPDDERIRLWRQSVGQRLLAVDDGEVLTISCQGFPRLRNDVVMGQLSAADAWLNNLAAGPGIYDEAAATLTLKFPSLALFPHRVSDLTALKLELKTQFKQRRSLLSAGDAKTWVLAASALAGEIKLGDPIPLTYLGIKKAAVKPKPGFSLVASTTTIIMDKDGKGDVRFGIQEVEKDAKLDIQGTLDGATLLAVTNAGKKVTEDALLWKGTVVDGNQVVDFKLGGLNPGSEVSIGATNTVTKGAANVLKFKVVLPATK